jgi:glycosyltransferase involved in cell wall biosynthesis
VGEELPMCIISSSYNNNARFRIEANLNSVFLQNYTNFKHVIVNDASTDGSGEVYRNYFSFHSIDKAKYAYIENTKRITAL